MADGQVVFEITGDGTKAKAAINDVIKAMQDAGVKLDKTAGATADGVESKFTGAFKAISAAALAMKAGKALLDFGKDAIQAASDLEEVQNVVDVTFGDGAAQIEKWAKAAGQQFGLTETQAKKFTSTLGAMMKSAGLAGPEIVSMSTDLAGLAADMASFYNLDFDTAFQKIRSGISGETEPLKQLGINMSVANLEAFALTQGITKAFNEMSQGEQTMLRYQYLMQATADAQGDFARTSDGYANSVRALETNIASLKTSIGEVILPIISSFVSDINDLISAITTDKPDTVLDDFAAIDLDTATKMAEIEATANKAADLTTALEHIQSDVDSMSRKKLDFGDWSDVLEVIDAFGNFQPSGNAGKSITDLADALNGNDPNTDRAQAWQELVGALSTDIEGLSKLTGKSPEETKKWLEEIAVGANSLDPNSAEGWDSLFKYFAAGLPGLTDTNMAGIFGLMANDAENADRYMEALGFDAEQIAEAHKEWLSYCKWLVQTIPGLNEIINTETGEVEGGTEAIRKYYTEWQETQEKILRGKAYYAKRAAIEKKRAELYDLQLEAELKRIEADRRKQEMIDKYGSWESIESYVKGARARSAYSGSDYTFGEEAAYNEYLEIEKEAIEADAELLRQKEDLATAEENLATWGEENADALEAYTEAADGATDATIMLTEAQQNAVEAAYDALKKVGEYAESVFEDTKRNIDAVADGFHKIETPWDKALAQQKDLNDAFNRGTIAADEFDKKMTDIAGDIPTIQNMTEGLRDQEEYWKEYADYMAAARARGVSEDILAYLSDGSTQSFDYLKTLATGEGDVEEVNDAWKDLTEAKKAAAEELTNTRLGADDEFQSLVKAAQDAMEGLDLYDQAETAMKNTVQGIADGIGEGTDAVEQQVNRLNNILGNINPLAAKFNFQIDGSHATGLDYVPFNNYLAQLHEGESVLTAEEAKVWRAFKNSGVGSANSIDYETMGGVMRDNIKPGGNVYLDGRIVGAVISQQQGNAYRALERSGWQG